MEDFLYIFICIPRFVESCYSFRTSTSFLFKQLLNLPGEHSLQHNQNISLLGFKHISFLRNGQQTMPPNFHLQVLLPSQPCPLHLSPQNSAPARNQLRLHRQNGTRQSCDARHGTTK